MGEGTWCDHKPNKNTMVGILSELMETSNFQIVRYYAGIGTYSSYSDRFVGGMPSLDSLLRCGWCSARPRRQPSARAKCVSGTRHSQDYSVHVLPVNA